MDQPQTDFAAARNNMVDCQIRPNRVTDPRVLDAMRTLPREQFVPSALMSLAYLDEDLPLGAGRVLMEPLVIARLVQMARVRPGDKVLVVGSGTGYSAAIVDACGGRVTALEEDNALIATAMHMLPRLAPAVQIVEGRLAAGMPGSGPWDVIIIEGAVTAIPEVYESQLTPGGRLVTVIAATGISGGRAVLAEPIAGMERLRTREMFDCTTTLLPSLRPAAAFVF